MSATAAIAGLVAAVVAVGYALLQPVPCRQGIGISHVAVIAACQGAAP